MDLKIISPNDFSFHCRTCASRLTESKYEICEMPTLLLQFFQYLTEFETSENNFYPGDLCGQCYIRLNEAYEFYIMCKQSKDFFDEMTVAFNSTAPETRYMENKIYEDVLDPLRTSDEKDTSLEDPLNNEQYEEIEIKVEDDITIELIGENNNTISTINETNEVSNISTSETFSCTVCNKCYKSNSALEMHMKSHLPAKPFKCNRCDRSFNAKISLQRHSEVHLEKPLQISCKYGCGKIFNRSVNAYAHYQRTHRKKEKPKLPTQTFKCEKCNLNFNAAVCLRHHMEIHLEEPLQISCKYGCGKVFNRTRNAYAHYQRRHRKTENPKLSNQTFKCEQCNRSFNAAVRLRHHMEIHLEKPLQIICKYGCGKVFNRTLNAYAHYHRQHSKTKSSIKTNIQISEDNHSDQSFDTNNEDSNKQNFDSISKNICNICGKSYTTASGLALHLPTHNEVPAFQCDTCDKGFNAKISLKRHMEIHLEDPLQIVCKYGCGKVFNRSHQANKHYQFKHPKTSNDENLINHETTATNKPTNNPTYICEECGKVFKSLLLFKQHRNRHLPYEERPYPCTQCNKRFVAPTDLLVHKRRHQGLKNFECSQCGLKFVTGRELRLHTSNAHTKEMQVSCNICSKTFLHLGTLKRHQKAVHLGIKNHKCKFCEQTFAKAETLRNHEMRHTGERPHKCNYCEKSFIQSFMRNSHMKKHHQHKSD